MATPAGLTRWRLADDGLAGYYRYAAMCPACGLRIGWPSAKAAQRHIGDLEISGFATTGLRVDEYEPVLDETCAGHP